MEITRELLDKYNRKECTPAERLAVEEWLNVTDSDNEEFPLPEKEEQINHQIREALHLPVPLSGLLQKRVIRINRLVKWSAAAAIVLVATVAVCYMHQQSAGNFDRKVVATQQWKTVNTGNGQQTRIALSDGSVVTLNHASSMKYPATFTDSNRTIYLNGQAFFEVVSDAGRPFIVQTATAATRVLGTSFDVQAYDKESTVVTVTNGRVLVSCPAGNQKNIVISAGQQAGFLNNKLLPLHNVYAAAHTAWTNRTLVLSDKSIADIAAILHRWYNVQIQITNKALSQEHFTGEFNNASIEEVLKQIAFVIKCNYTIKQDKIMIY